MVHALITLLVVAFVYDWRLGAALLVVYLVMMKED